MVIENNTMFVKDGRVVDSDNRFVSRNLIGMILDVSSERGRLEVVYV